MRTVSRAWLWVAAFIVLWATGESRGEDSLRVAVFRVDATPPLGAPLCDALVMPAARVDDRLSARGVILLGSGKPIVLVAVDWVGIGNGGQQAWRTALAEAVGTTAQRVAVHTLHQHDAPGCDFSAEELLDKRGLGGKQFHVTHARETIAAAARAARDSLAGAQSVSHVGFGSGRVERVASNRRVLGPDGKVEHVRFSSCKNPAAIAAPEGTIDPNVRLVSLWRHERPLVVLSYYATHPQSYYGKGGVSADFVGAAREQREKELAGPTLIHFNGAGGNVAAGKYNDGSPANRAILAGRLAAGMKLAWEATRKEPLAARDVDWQVEPVKLPPSSRLVAAELERTLDDPGKPENLRIRAARDLTWLRRCQAGEVIDLGCLRLGKGYVLHLPGELFVEYQLAAQAARSEQFVAVAAYGDYGPGYIGTREAYGQGGYETSYVSRVAPEVESVLNTAIRKMLGR